MYIVAVLGKGGVGKTTTCCGLALALQAEGYQPGILDLDLENPSVAGRGGVTGLTHQNLTYTDKLMVPPRWMGIPIMSHSLMFADGFEDTPVMLDEKRKHFIIRHLFGEVDWTGTDVLLVDMPPGTGEEVRGLLQLNPDSAVIVTAPQRISESAVHKVVAMAQEYAIPLVGFVENQQNGVAGEAGHRLAAQYGLPLLAQIPWSISIPTSMEEHVPFDHQLFIPVAQALTAQLSSALRQDRPLTSEKEDLLRRAEAWAAGKPRVFWDAPAEYENIAIGGELRADMGADIHADISADEGEPWKLFHEMTDEQWDMLEELLPEAMHGERARFNGILWVYTTRNRWRDMPRKYGKYNTGRNRAQRLRDQGLWNRFMEQAKEFGYARTRGEFFAQRRRRQL